MNENHDADTGQFVPAEPLTGREGLEHDAGYVPYEEEGAEAEENLTTAEAAENLALSRTPESAIKTYGLDLPDNVSLTLDQAAKITSDVRKSDAMEAEDSEAQKIRDEVDALRGVKPEAKSTEPAQPQLEGDDVSTDDEIEKALSNPRIAEALSRQIGEAEQTRQQYAAGIDAATKIAQASFIAQFPEFANVPEDQRGAVLGVLQHQNPQRFNQVLAAVQSTQQLFEASARVDQQRQAETKHKFTEYARNEDARFADMMKGEDMGKITGAVIELVKDYGADPAQFFEAYANEPIMRRAEFQRMMVDAAKYNQLTKAPPKAAPKTLPPVQRPGAAAPRVSADVGRVQTLERQLASAGSAESQMRIAAEMMTLKRASKRG